MSIDVKNPLKNGLKDTIFHVLKMDQCKDTYRTLLISFIVIGVIVGIVLVLNGIVGGLSLIGGHGGILAPLNTLTTSHWQGFPYLMIASGALAAIAFLGAMFYGAICTLLYFKTKQKNETSILANDKPEKSGKVITNITSDINNNLPEKPKPTDPPVSPQKNAILANDKPEKSDKVITNITSDINNNVPEKPKPTDPPISLELEEKINLGRDVTPTQKMMFEYCRYVPTRGEAVDLLKKKGKNSGDYTFTLGNYYYNFILFVRNDQGKIVEYHMTDPLVVSGQTYDEFYELIGCPVIPNNCSISSDELHQNFMEYRDLAFARTIDGKLNEQLFFPIGIFQRLLNRWKIIHPSSFNPCHFYVIFAHIFTLKGKFYARNSKQESVEGTSNSLGKSVIMQDVLSYVSNAELDDNIKIKLKEMCTHSCISQDIQHNPSPKTLMDLLNKEIPITIFSGWPGHSINITMTKNELIFINRGAGAKVSGLTRYSINKKITEKDLQEILSYDTPECFPGPHKGNKLKELLSLKKIDRTLLSSQKTGNCVFASNLHSFEAALQLLGFSKNDASLEFKKFRSYIRKYWLQASLDLIKHSNSDEFLSLIASYTIKLFIKQTILNRLNDDDQAILDDIKKGMEDLDKIQPNKTQKIILEIIQGIKDKDLNKIPNDLKLSNQKTLLEFMLELSIYYSSKKPKK